MDAETEASIQPFLSFSLDETAAISCELLVQSLKTDITNISFTGSGHLLVNFPKVYSHIQRRYFFLRFILKRTNRKYVLTPRNLPLPVFYPVAIRRVQPARSVCYRLTVVLLPSCGVRCDFNMNTVLSRANSLFAFSLSVMAALTFGCFITTAFKDRRVPVNIHVAKVML